MEHEFWHERWRDNRIGFHEAGGNAHLIANFSCLDLLAGARVFVPLCGKTRDIGWLLDQGFRVSGAELSRLAVQSLFDDLNVVPEVSQAGPLEKFSAPGLDIYVGDIFDLTKAELGETDAVYDRAALVALPDDMRKRYGEHLATSPHARPNS